MSVARFLIPFVLGGFLPLVSQAPQPGTIQSVSPSQAEGRKIVQDMAQRRIEAMKAKDLDAYMALLGKNEKEYLVEQRNWFLIYQKAPVTEFATSVSNIRIKDPDTILAEWRDSFIFSGEKKETRDATYTKVLRRTPEGWKDCDLDFLQIETPHFVVKAPRDAKRIADLVGKQAEQAYAHVTGTLGLSPADRTVIKLYPSRELVRHSSDISVEWLFGGWYEYGESIKFFAYPKKRDFTSGIAHELTHKITLSMSDSMANWLAEGLAVAYGSCMEGRSPLKEQELSVDEVQRSLDWLKTHNLWVLSGHDVDRFYGMSGMVVAFIKERHGQDKLVALLQELRKSPRYDRGFDPTTMEPENQKRTENAIQAVFGLSWEAFDKAWLDWISTQK